MAIHTERRSTLPNTQRLLVWLLLCVLPVQGLAAVLVQRFGPLHFHSQADGAQDPMRGWQDFRRQIDGEGRHAMASHHAHDDVARHHHPAGVDASAVVVASDPGDAAQSDEAPAGASGALAQVIGPLGGTAMAPPTAAREPWPAASATTIRSWLPASIERPPRAG